MEKNKNLTYVAIVLGFLSVVLFVLVGYFYIENRRLADELAYDAQDLPRVTEQSIDEANGEGTREKSKAENELESLLAFEVVDTSNYTDMEIIAENSDYNLWLVNYEKSEIDKTGELLFVSKEEEKKGILIDERIDIFGSAEISETYDNRYVVLTSGTSPQRGGEVIDLYERNLVNSLCTVSGYDYADDVLFYSNCDLEDNRPWGAGEASSIIAMNLKSGEEKIVLQSNVTEHFNVKSVDNGILKYERVYDNSAEWGDDYNKETKELNVSIVF